jgi:hypothetical protein
MKRKTFRFLEILGHDPRQSLLAEAPFRSYIYLAMTTKEQALTAISELPENTDLLSIIRELSFLAGIEEASREISKGEGMDSSLVKNLVCLAILPD